MLPENDGARRFTTPTGNHPDEKEPQQRTPSAVDGSADKQQWRKGSRQDRQLAVLKAISAAAEKSSNDTRTLDERFQQDVVPWVYRRHPYLRYLSERDQLMLFGALWWAHHGWKVFPTNGKIPAIPSPHARGHRCKGQCGLDGHGSRDATTDRDKIIEWWSGRCSGRNVSVVIPDHYLCLDLDPRHGADGALAALESEHGALPPTLTIVSGRGDGGTHRIFRRRLGQLHATIAEGIECKAVSVAPPSIHPDTGNEYVLEDRSIADAPEWLLRLAIKPAPPTREQRWQQEGPSAFDAFNARGESDWHDLLTRHDWQLVWGDPDEGESCWRHPDATHETSAKLVEGTDGLRRLYVFSTSTAFEASTPGSPCGHDYFDAVATLEHDGSRAALYRHMTRNPLGSKDIHHG